MKKGDSLCNHLFDYTQSYSRFMASRQQKTEMAQPSKAALEINNIVGNETPVII